MKAVNLIPADQRRGAGTGGGFATYALLGVLVLVLAGVTAYVVTANQIHQRRSDLARATERRQATEAQVAGLQPYVQFAQLEQSRLKTVHDLAASRFDWERAMRGLSRVTTRSVWLTSMVGTVAPGVEVGSTAGSAGSSSELRGDEPGPAVELAGCAVSNQAVVGYLTRLRALHGVTHVSLSDAQKKDSVTGSSGSGTTTSTASGGSAGNTDCGPSTHVPAFDVVVFFAAPSGAAAAGAAGAAGTPPATTGTTTPASAPAGGNG